MGVALRWIGVIAAATAADLVVRFVLPLDQTGVLRVEAILFPLTGLALLALFRAGPRLSPGWRRAQIVAVAAFSLAGLRAGLWAGGVPVNRANLAALGVGALTWLGIRLFRRGDGEDTGASGDA